MKKVISVIIPVYNAEKFLEKSIESVINQTYQNFELILINDGSVDNSGAICNKYALIDKRIKVISRENSGPAASRNVGVRNAIGDFVFFLDADDFIDRKTFEALIIEYDKYQSDLVMSNFCKLENSGKIINQKVTFTPDGKPFTNKIKILSKTDIADYVRHFLKHPSNHLVSYCWARLYKLSVIKNNNIFANEKMRLFEDFVFNLEYLKYADKVVFVNEPFYTYTMPNNHITASMAIVKSDSLLRDMALFKQRTNDFFQQSGAGFKITTDINKKIGHALTHYAIIFLIRSCRQITRENKKIVYNEIKKIINSEIFKESSRHYSPSKGNSKIFPIMAKFKMINLIILYCQFKAYKRYGKIKF
ncbi:glycosyltransferase family 2 protein [Candidatus Wolfebacteria bacterium]|nr:glycosyltransferase family 2 protein [Candidatus Wolfebacteria bacterium]